MKSLLRVLLPVAAGVAMLAFSGCSAGDGGGSCGGCGGPGEPPRTEGGRTIPGDAVYRCPMDGAELRNPGACPKCGMALDERHRVVR